PHDQATAPGPRHERAFRTWSRCMKMRVKQATTVQSGCAQTPAGESKALVSTHIAALRWTGSGAGDVSSYLLEECDRRHLLICLSRCQSVAAGRSGMALLRVNGQDGSDHVNCDCSSGGRGTGGSGHRVGDGEGRLRW